MLKPMIGMPARFYHSEAHRRHYRTQQPLAAKVVGVHSVSSVDLVAWDANGVSSGVKDVLLIQDGDGRKNGDRPTVAYCEYLPEAEKVDDIKEGEAVASQAKTQEQIKTALAGENVPPSGSAKVTPDHPGYPPGQPGPEPDVIDHAPLLSPDRRREPATSDTNWNPNAPVFGGSQASPSITPSLTPSRTDADGKPVEYPAS